MAHNQPVSVRNRWKIVQWVVFEGQSVPEVAARIERSLTVVYRYINVYYETGDVLSNLNTSSRSHLLKSSS